jgi:hypothetical protein
MVTKSRPSFFRDAPTAAVPADPTTPVDSSVSIVPATLTPAEQLRNPHDAA